MVASLDESGEAFFDGCASECDGIDYRECSSACVIAGMQDE